VYKKILVSLLAVFAIVSYGNTYAHGGGGGGGSYTFDKKDNTVDQEAMKKSAEEQHARESWDDFMKAVKEQETKTNSDKKPGNHSSQ